MAAYPQQQVLRPPWYNDSTQIQLGSFHYLVPSPSQPNAVSTTIDSLVIPPPRMASPLSDNHQHYEVLCMSDNPYGQTFNMILTIAAARTIAYELTQSKLSNSSMNTSSSFTTLVKVGLGPFFSDFFDATLEPQEDILLYYYATSDGSIDEEKCQYSYRTMELFYRFFELGWNVNSRVQHIQTLIPKQSIREQAISYLHKFKYTDMNTNNYNVVITTVHRRNFEDTCHTIIQDRNNVACLDLRTGNKKPSIEFFTNDDLTNLCNLNYAMILADLNVTTSSANPKNNHIVLLCSDRQVPQFDSTFPHLVSITPKNVPNMEKNTHYKAIMIMIEAWIMSLSDIHYGIPMSTVDVVVHFWRTGPFLQQHPPWHTNGNFRREMKPQSCYGSSSV